MLTDAEIASLANFRTELVPEVDTVFGASNDPVNSTTAQVTTLGSFVEISLLLPDAATTTYKYTIPDKIEIVDVICIKDVSSAGNTIQLKNGSGTAISNAIAADTDKTVTRAGTLDKATRVVSAGGELQITNTKGAASAACAVFIKAIRRD